MIALISVFWSLGRQIPHVTRSCGKWKLINMESVNFVAFKWVDPFLKKNLYAFCLNSLQIFLKMLQTKMYNKTIRRIISTFDENWHKIAPTSVNKHCFSAFRNKPIFYVRLNLHYSFWYIVWLSKKSLPMPIRYKKSKQIIIVFNTPQRNSFLQRFESFCTVAVG